MSVSGEDAFQASDDLLRSAFKPDRSAVLRSLDPSRYWDEVSPTLTAASSRLPARRLPQRLLRGLTAAWVFSARCVEALSYPVVNPLTDRQPWLVPACGGIAAVASGHFFGVVVTFIAMGSLLLLTGGIIAFAIVGQALVTEEIEREGNPSAHAIVLLSRTAQHGAITYLQVRNVVTYIFETRQRFDEPCEDLERIENGWPPLRSSIMGEAVSLEKLCEMAGTSAAEQAAAPIVMASAALAEGMSVLVAAVDHEDEVLLASVLDDDEILRLLEELQAIEALAGEQSS